MDPFGKIGNSRPNADAPTAKQRANNPAQIVTVAITGVGSISSIGSSSKQAWDSYCSKRPFIRSIDFDGSEVPVAGISENSEKILCAIRGEKSINSHLDKTVLMAIHCARGAVKQAGWKASDRSMRTGVNIGSSRGATGIFEKQHAAYIAAPSERISPLTSPTTTLGNISSFVAHDIEADGPVISHSVTCSTALQSIFNGIAWMKAGLADRFIVGGAEAPLTGFTVAQMRALRIYSQDISADFPCRPCSSETPSKNTFVLGEGAAAFTLEMLSDLEGTGRAGAALAVIESFGYGLEAASSAVDITENGEALRRSMAMAMSGMSTDAKIDAIITHAPGTIKGDRSELSAVKTLFGSQPPIILSNKWALGHTFGASGALSLELALLMLLNDTFIDFPYPVLFSNAQRPIRKIMINSAGFGGNAASIIISRRNV